MFQACKLRNLRKKVMCTSVVARVSRIVSEYCFRMYHTWHSTSTSRKTAHHKIDTHAGTGSSGRTAVQDRRSNSPSVTRHYARSTHIYIVNRWMCEDQLPTTYTPGSSAVVRGPIRRNTRRSLPFHYHCCIANNGWRTQDIVQENPYITPCHQILANARWCFQEGNNFIVLLYHQLMAHTIYWPATVSS